MHKLYVGHLYSAIGCVPMPVVSARSAIHITRHVYLLCVPVWNTGPLLTALATTYLGRCVSLFVKTLSFGVRFRFNLTSNHSFRLK
jgi:hypothetical protein